MFIFANTLTGQLTTYTFYAKVIWRINKEVIKKPNQPQTKIVITINAFFVYAKGSVSLFHAMLMSFDIMWNLT